MASFCEEQTLAENKGCAQQWIFLVRAKLHADLKHVQSLNSQFMGQSLKSKVEGPQLAIVYRPS